MAEKVRRKPLNNTCPHLNTVFTTKDEVEKVRDLLMNIKSKTRENNGEVMIKALERYYEYIRGGSV